MIVEIIKKLSRISTSWFATLITFFSLMIIFGFMADRFDNSKPFLAQLLSLSPSSTSTPEILKDVSNKNLDIPSTVSLSGNFNASFTSTTEDFNIIPAPVIENLKATSTPPSQETVNQVAPGTSPVSEENISQDTAPQLLTISQKLPKIRKLEKEIMIDKQASNRCYVKPFVINLSGVASAQAEIIFEITKGTSAEIEVGSLPFDIDLVFSQNNDYFITPQSGQNRLGLTINKGEQAQRGSFSIPIIFTKKGDMDSTTICQINIINL